MPAFIEIVKAENGNIEFNGLTGTQGGFKGLTFNGDNTINQKDSDVFQVMDGSDIVYSFRFADVVSTQIAPAAAVPIGATTADEFFTLMRTSFFFSPVASSGGGSTFEGSPILVEDFLYSPSGTRILFDTEVNGTGQINVMSNGQYENLDGTLKSRNGGGAMQIDGDTDDYAYVASPFPINLNADINLQTTWDIRVRQPIIDDNEEGCTIIIGYCSALNGKGSGFYARPPKVGETDTIKFAVTANDGAEVLIHDSTIVYNGADNNRGFFNTGTTLSGGNLTFTATDGTATDTFAITDFFTTYPDFADNDLYSIVLIIQPTAAIPAILRFVIYDRTTFALGSNFPS